MGVVLLDGAAMADADQDGLRQLGAYQVVADELEALVQRAIRTRLVAVSAEPLARVEYAEVVDAETFQPVATLSGRLVLPLAVRIGGTRLIDNLPLKVPPSKIAADGRGEISS